MGVGLIDNYTPDGDDGAEIDVDLGGGDLTPADVFASPGEDSPPLKGDDAALVDVEGASDTFAAVAFADDTPRVAEPGEKRTYARDSSGAVVAEIHMRGDGSVSIERTGGTSVTVGADDSLTVDGPFGASITMSSTGAIELDSVAGNVSISDAGAISISGASVSMRTGTDLGAHFLALYAALTAWTPANPLETDAAALKLALAPYLAQTPPGP